MHDNKYFTIRGLLLATNFQYVHITICENFSPTLFAENIITIQTFHLHGIAKICEVSQPEIVRPSSTTA